MTGFAESKDTFLDKVGRILADRLETQTSGYEPYTPSDSQTLARTLRPGDVLLIEGNQKVSATIKYLTQSTWSHAAFFAGDFIPMTPEQAALPVTERPQLIEVNLGEGCVAASLKKYSTYNTRICRPNGLTPDDRDTLVSFMIDSLGLKYDLKNILDMLRFFMPSIPIPVRWRRRLIAFGSGDPTRAICSSLIAAAFERIHYPILPEITRAPGRAAAASTFSRSEILHIRHHSLYTPRDFDLSPYFSVVKPTLEYGFDYKQLTWQKQA
ncbi:lipo-like protein [Pararhizobium sp.]|uniref:lipo-like protein n=1 Tax=Pararhizobium sp. TaxID=1977563 RepID=UPI002722A793|nr:lipo-like protein [Pararhizobium sp.]MDO9416437.1 lipo-like protein [Pararhizobium sp.]